MTVVMVVMEGTEGTEGESRGRGKGAAPTGTIGSKHGVLK